ncbi:MAG: YIP1 family protein [Caldilineaceae bacterium SB0661_bin_32]|uniref:YIP1 family protein n=1 Tax=Caldilineaceae bacterium SB0661_bin_32 TaxID=2605255 RepID=A0A6B1D5Y7_9CHLR|nr:YIP1 family protein [Caldilineaceae bacterium SB0661_bin_32]
MDLQSILQTWINVLTKPGEEVFAAEREKTSATLSTALVWMILAAVVTALLGLLQAQILGSAMGGMGQIVDLLPSELQGEFGTIAESSATEWTGFSLLSIIFLPLFFLIGVGVYHLIATVLGGRGQYGRYAYLTATYSAPLMIVGSVLGFVPVLGGCLNLILGIYQFVLTYFAVKVEYGLSQGRAIVVVVIPLLAGLVLAVCLATLVVGTLVAVFGGSQ